MEAYEPNPEAELFVFLSYDVLRSVTKDGAAPYEFVHTVWSGFNTAFSRMFPGIKPVEYTKMLAEEGLIQLRLAKGGAQFKLCRPLLQDPSPEQVDLMPRMRHYLEAFAGVEREAPKPWKKGTLLVG